MLAGWEANPRDHVANEGSVSPVGSAEGKRPEFVSAKRAQAPLQGTCATIERTGLRIRSAQIKHLHFLQVLFQHVRTGLRIPP